MRKLGFSLIELLIVIILMGIISYLIIRVPSFYSKNNDILHLRDLLSPDGNITVYENGLINSTKKVEFNCKNPTVYKFINGNFVQDGYPDINNTQVIFKYTVKNGIGESMILKCDNGFYVFKPFKILKTKNFETAKTKFLNKKYFPKLGSIH